MGSLLRDISFALSQFWRRPLLCGAAVLSLALGIGANTTIFSYANALLFETPAVSHPETLAEVYTHDPDPNAVYGGYLPLSYLDYKDIREQSQAFSDIAIYDPLAQATMNRGGQQEGWLGELVSGNFFPMLGITPALGRWILPTEASTPGTAAVVVLSYHRWQTDFGGKAEVLGQKILLNRAPYVVVGVAPASFTGMIKGLDTDFFAPVTMADRLGAAGMLVRASRTMFGVGRLKPGVTLTQATADLNVVQKRLDAAYPNADRARFGGLAAKFGAEPALFRGSVEGANLLLMVIVGLVLLIACFNAANLLLVQAYGRKREWAVRTALGASRGRLLRQGLTESLLLALVAGALGLNLGRVTAPLLLRLKPPGFPVDLQFGLDARLLLFTLALALGTGILFGVAPAWQAAKTDAIHNLKDGAAGLGSARQRLRSTMIAGQVAICVVVLVGAGLCLRSLQHANAIDPGFDTDHLVVGNVDANGLGYQGTAARAYFEKVEDEVAATPGVTATAGAIVMPLSQITAQTDALAAGMQPPPGKRGITLDMAIVGPGYFAATGTKLLRGRDFTRVDLPPIATWQPPTGIPKEPDYVVVNQTLAEHFWPGRDAVGQDLEIPFGDHVKHAKVVGVAENGKYRTLGEAPRMYLFELAPIQSGQLLIRTTAPAEAAAPALRASLAKIDPNLVDFDIEPARAGLAVLLFPVHATSLLLIGFGALALALALLGLYAVIATSVAQRTREFGVRIALGAAPAQVLATVLRQGLKLALAGIGTGLALAALATRAISGLLYGVSALDPAAYAATALLLAAVALAASYFPARRAAGVDPMVALRYE